MTARVCFAPTFATELTCPAFLHNLLGRRVRCEIVLGQRLLAVIQSCYSSLRVVALRLMGWHLRALHEGLQDRSKTFHILRRACFILKLGVTAITPHLRSWENLIRFFQSSRTQLGIDLH